MSRRCVRPRARPARSSPSRTTTRPAGWARPWLRRWRRWCAGAHSGGAQATDEQPTRGAARLRGDRCRRHRRRGACAGLSGGAEGRRCAWEVAADHWGLRAQTETGRGAGGGRPRDRGLRRGDLIRTTTTRTSSRPWRAVAAGEVERGIVACGSGVRGVRGREQGRGRARSAHHRPYSARQGVEDDDMNVICLGGRVLGPELALELADAHSPRATGARPRYDAAWQGQINWRRPP